MVGVNAVDREDLLQPSILNDLNGLVTARPLRVNYPRVSVQGSVARLAEG
jgi:hypothetical protein